MGKEEHGGNQHVSFSNNTSKTFFPQDDLKFGLFVKPYNKKHILF